VDRDKNAGRPEYVVTAQIIERSAGFIVGAIVSVMIACFVLVF
jgi:hypothetical protein